MSETKHTPGQWKAEGPFDLVGGKGRQVLEIGAETGAGHLSVASVGFDGETGEGAAASWADARLIAAAPELLEVLSALLAEDIGTRGVGPLDTEQFYCEFCKATHADYSQIPHEPTCPVTKARAALAKMEGGAR